jgi:hypothetical protein
MKRFLICLLFLSFVLPGWTQEKPGIGPKEKSLKKEMSLRKQIRRENRDKRRKERAERRKVKKHHKRIQTKKVRKRMKESKGTAARNNDNKREFFMKRWFKKKNKGRVKKSKKD